jgi:bisanhydrobacterioruberin hydratase
MKDYSKFLWIISIFLFIAAFFVAKVPIIPEMAPISGIFIIILAFPSYYALYRWLGLKKSLTLLIVLSIYALGIETLAIITGLPYSSFHYTDLIGFKIGGYTPYTVPFAYVPVFLGCIYLASTRISDKLKIIIFSTFLVLITDFMLDPAAVALQFWIYEKPGIFYGVPLMNFLGWILTGFLASLITITILKKDIDKPKPRAMVSSLFLILIFWSSICLFLGLIIPGIIGFILISYILWQTRFKVGEFEF